MTSPSPRGSLWLRCASVLLLFAGLYVLFQVYDVGDAASKAWMDAHVRHHGARGVLVYVGLVALLTGMGVPRQLCSALGGYVFGACQGTLWATLGTGLACCCCFSYARFLGQDWLHRHYEAKVRGFNGFICQSPFLLTLLIRIVPLGSNFLTNFIAGMSRIPALPFLGGSLVGFTIQNAIFALLGSGVRAAQSWQTPLSIALYVTSLGLGVVVYRRYRAYHAHNNR